jgi:hypothetical protein
LTASAAENLTFPDLLPKPTAIGGTEPEDATDSALTLNVSTGQAAPPFGTTFSHHGATAPLGR